jgi:L-rhamnose-H+ transport protein
MDALAPALATVATAGFFQGSFMTPSKWIRGWAWENYWLIFAVVAYLVSPWTLALATIPQIFAVYARCSAQVLLLALLFGTLWGLGAVTFGLGVDALGIALGFAIILGVATAGGTLIPLIVLPGAQVSTSLLALTLAALAVMLLGVAVCSLAGRWKESTVSPKSYSRGVAICLASGILSACGNLGFNFGGEVTAQAQRLGVPSHLAANALWTLLTLPLFAWNAGYAVVLLKRNATFARYRQPGLIRSAALAALMGVMWMTGMALYGAGARMLGPLGPSLGWAILMSVMVIVANVAGFATGEWTPAPAAARRRLALGIALLVLAIGALGILNGIKV